MVEIGYLDKQGLWHRLENYITPIPDQAPKLDGRLLTRYGEREFKVWARQGNVVLTPTEALSLLAALEDERETLERLAEEK